MKRIYLIGFRGTGFRSAQHNPESLLVRAGHVGFYFEGEENFIFGFHPTEEACRAVGDDEAVKEWLKEHNSMSGALYNDTDVFQRAAVLSQANAPTTVWQMAIEISDETFKNIRDQAYTWYNERKTFTYAFPSEEDSEKHDNCATFPRHLGIPLPEPTGNLREYIPALAASGETWTPKGAEDVSNDADL